MSTQLDTDRRVAEGQIRNIAEGLGHVVVLIGLQSDPLKVRAAIEALAQMQAMVADLREGLK